MLVVTILKYVNVSSQQDVHLKFNYVIRQLFKSLLQSHPLSTAAASVITYGTSASSLHTQLRPMAMCIAHGHSTLTAGVGTSSDLFQAAWVPPPVLLHNCITVGK